jgi:Asp-tRNA(Asn)/Glu-tRNA(Gln) amidotransferase A subunit family amidase
MKEPWRLSMSAALREGAAAQDVAAGCRARIAARDPELHAWVRLSEQEPVVDGPLRGLPIGVKDVIDTADLPTECGSAVHRGRRPPEDAACVTLLRRAGATVLGKTVTTELASFSPGPTRNPHDPAHTPGGSSSGSAAAVADGMAPVALGTQTAASMVRPASFCGVVGYAASRGDLPMRGVNPLAPGLDTLGVFAREVADVALVRSLLLRASVAPVQAPAAPRLAVWEAPELEAPMAAVLASAAESLSDAGAEVVRPDLGAHVAELTTLHERVMAYEVARTLVWEDERRELVNAPLVALIDEGLGIAPDEARRMRLRVEELRGLIGAAVEGSDAVLAAAASGPAPAGLDSTGSPAQSRPWQVLGLPAVALPAGMSDGGLPLGVQLVGRRFCDDDLLGLAAWAEGLLPPAVRPW